MACTKTAGAGWLAAALGAASIAVAASSGEPTVVGLDQAALVERLARGSESDSDRRDVASLAARAVSRRAPPMLAAGLGRTLDGALAALVDALEGPPAGREEPLESLRALDRFVEAELAAIHERILQLGASPRLIERWTSARDRYRGLVGPVIAAGTTSGDEAHALRRALQPAREAIEAAAAAAHPSVLGALPYRRPRLAPRAPSSGPTVTPSYAHPSPGPATSADLEATPESPLAPAILSKAEELGWDYVRIFEFVRNEVATEWYAGSLKGAEETLRQGAGNDVDQASLLLALLRTSQLAGRYVTGVVELPVERVASSLGLPDPDDVPRALARAGVAHQPVVQGNRVVAVEVEQTWVTVFAPYANYRGAVVDLSGRSWVPLAPALGEVEATAAAGVLEEMDLDLEAFAEDHLARSRSELPMDRLRLAVESHLAATGAGSYAGQLARRVPVEQRPRLLPSSLPVPVVRVLREAPTLEEEQRHTVRLVARSGLSAASPVVFDETVALAELAGRRVTLSYTPATVDDHQIVNAYGGLGGVPCYLVELRLQLKVDGRLRLAGPEALDMGVPHRLDLTLAGPAGSETIVRRLTSGSYYALDLGAGESVAWSDDGPDPADTEGLAARLLARIGRNFGSRWAAAERELADLAGLALVRPWASLALVDNVVAIETLAGLPLRLHWQGVTLDALSRAVEPLAAGPEGESAWLALAALQGSALEHAVFEHDFLVDAVSADRALQMARDDGTVVLRLDAATLPPALPGLVHPPWVKAELEAAVAAGYEVEIPETGTVRGAWQGSAWRVIDPQGLGAGYLLAGGLAGGATVEPPGAWILAFLEAALAQPYGAGVNLDPLAGASAARIEETDEQRGAVDAMLSTPLGVLVRDGLGQSVVGAEVTFVAVDGGGALVDDQGNGHAALVVATDLLGRALAPFRLGSRTAENPVLENEDPADARPSRALLHRVDAMVRTQTGSLPIDQPFTALGFPGEPVALRRTDGADPFIEGEPAQWSGNFPVVAEDVFGNPVSNVTLLYAAGAAESDESCSNAVLDPERAHLFEHDDPACPPIPFLGDCGSPLLSVISAADAIVTGVILGDALSAVYPVTVSAPQLPEVPALTSTYFVSYARNPVTGECGSLHTVDLVSPFLTDDQGRNIQAASAGTAFAAPLRLEVRAWEADYDWWCNPVSTPCTWEWRETDSGKWVPGAANLELAVDAQGAATPAGEIGPGAYETVLTTGPAPAFNGLTARATEVRATLDLACPVCDPVQGCPGELPWWCPASGAPPHPFEKRYNDLERSPTGVWGLLPRVTGVSPEPVTVDHGGRTTRLHDVLYEVEPVEYPSSATQLELLDNGSWSATFEGGGEASGGRVVMPRATLLDPEASNEVELVLHRGTATEVRSERWELPLDDPLLTPPPEPFVVGLDVDVAGQAFCAQVQSFTFKLSREAEVDLVFHRIESVDPEGAPHTGEERVMLEAELLAAGEHGYRLSPADLGDVDFVLPPGDWLYELTATATEGGQARLHRGRVRTYLNPSDLLSVSHVLVEGVDVWGGTLTLRREEWSLEGRGAPLDLVRTYSSGYDAEPGPLGLGWTHNWNSHVTVTPCGEVIVVGGEGSGMRFVDDGLGGLRPTAGYHGTLIADAEALAFDFYAKSGRRYHYQSTGSARWVLTFVEDPDGNRVDLLYDGSGAGPLLTAVRDGAGRTLAFRYEQRTFLLAAEVELWTGQVLVGVDGPGGLVASFAYDGRGHLVEARREDDARVETYTYSPVIDPLVPFRTVMTSVTDGLDGGVTRYEYTTGRIGIQGVLEVPRVLVERVVRPMGGETTFAYDLVGLLERSGAELVHGVTDARGEATLYGLDTYGAPVRIVDPLGHETRMTWTPDDRLMTSRTDANGHTTTYAYDEHGNRLSEQIEVVDVAGTSHLYRRETVYLPPEQFAPPYIKDRPASRTDRNGRATTFAYDAAGHLLESRTLAGGTAVATRHTYLGNGDRASTTDPEGRTTFFQHDAWGHLAVVTDALGGESTTVWDERGLPLSRTDALGRTTTFEHDRLARQIAVHGPLGATERTLWDDAANRTTRTDAEGRVRVEERDLEERVVREVDPEGAERLFAYDLAGNKILETTWFDFDTPRLDITFEYDPAGRLRRRLEPLGRETLWGHDAVGNVVREVLADAGDPGFTPRVSESDYDALARRIRLTRFLDEQPVVHETLYDGEGNVLAEVDPLGRETRHLYDALNRRLATLAPEDGATRFVYDRQGNLVTEVRENDPADQVRQFVYDSLDRVVQRRDATGAVHHLEYDAVGNLVREIDPLLNVTTHTVDALDRRIRTVDHLNRVTQPARTVVAEWEHDLVGNVVLERWPNGNEVEHVYDGLDRLLTSTDSVGAVVSYAYDARGNRVRETDGNGNVSTRVWDGLDRLRVEALPEDRTVSHEHDVAGNRIATTNARGHTTRYAYDTLDRVVEETAPPPFEHVRAIAYDLVGNRVAETDRRGLTTTYVYDDRDRLLATADPAPLSTTMTATWDRVGNKLAETDRRGISTFYEYDGENRLVRTERAGVELGRTVWDAAGNRRFEHDANGHVTGYEYDERNLLTAVNRPEASITRYVLDDMGDRVEETDPEGRVTTRSYDERRRPVEETDPALETTSFEHDGNGNVVARVRPLLGRWEMGFDGADRLVTVRDALGNETTYGYDENGNRTAVEDAEGNLTTYTWDELDRRVRMEYADGAFETYGYDPEGNLVSRIDPLGRTVATTWDELGRKSSESYPLPSPPTGDDLLSILWEHDGNGNPLKVEESYSGPSGTRVTRRVWDDLDRLSSVTDPEGRTLSYLYDANGNRTRLTDPDGKVTLYAFDGLNRPTSVAISGAGVTAYSYFKDSRLKRVAFSNGTRADYAYDATGRVASIANTLGAATISRYDYLYDANGNRTEQIEENGGAPETTGYAYDDADRLTDVAYPDRTVAYAYDGVSNRTGEQAVDPSGAPLVDRSLAYDERNQLTSITDHLDAEASVAYTWDANGNQTAKTTGATTTTFTFDLRDRLVQVTQGATLLGRYAYDHQDLRTYKETPTASLRTLYDDQSVLLQTDAATGNTLAKYDYGPDRLLSLNGATHGRQYYLHDALGSIANLTHPDGTLAARYQWDAWGNPRSSAGASENPFGFTGHERDEATGLYYAKARFYDAEVGRFLSEDPFEGEVEEPPSLHRYLYAYGNPTVFIDPTGEVVVTPREHLEEQENRKRLEENLVTAEARQEGLRQDPFSVDEEELRQAFLEPMRLRREIEKSQTRLQEGADFLERARVVVEGAETPDAQRRALIDLFKAEAGGMEYSVAVRLLGEFLDPLPCRDINCQMVQAIGEHARAVNALAAVVENVVYLAGGEMLLAGRVGSVGRGVSLADDAVRAGGQAADDAGRGIPRLVSVEGDLAAGSAPRGLATGANEAVFWSGIRGGDSVAAAWVSKHGGATLETTLARRGIQLPPWDPTNPARVAAWRTASAEFAAGARGNVRVLQADTVRVKSVWAEVELPALRANPNVTSITAVNPETGVEVVLWAR